MVGSFAGSQSVKMVPLDIVTSCFNVISNSRIVITFRKGLEPFSGREVIVSFSQCKNYCSPSN